MPRLLNWLLDLTATKPDIVLRDRADGDVDATIIRFADDGNRPVEIKRFRISRQAAALARLLY